MKIKLDENIPVGLVPILDELGHETDTVRDEGLKGRVDSHVWEAAQESGRFLITQDLDFSDVRRFAPGNHNGILMVRLVKPGGKALLKRIQDVFRTEKTDQWRGCFIVLTENKIRVRTPMKSIHRT